MGQTCNQHTVSKTLYVQDCIHTIYKLFCVDYATISIDKTMGSLLHLMQSGTQVSLLRSDQLSCPFPTQCPLCVNKKTTC